MKTKNYLYVAFLLVFTGCKVDKTVTEPVFDVSTETNTYKVNEEVKFNFTGNPDLISFYSGEPLHDYAFKDGRSVEAGDLKLSFESTVQFGTQANQLSVLYSTDFNGDFSVKNEVFEGAASFIDITSKFQLATGTTAVKNIDVDISDLRVANKPFYIAFKYNVKNQSPTANGGFGLGRTWTISNFSFISKTQSIGNVLLGDNTTSAFRPIDLKPDIAPTRSVLAPTVKLVAHLATPENISVETATWAVSKRFEVGAQKEFGPDRPIPVKGMIDEAVTDFSYTFSKAGTYKVYFVAANANVNGKKEVVKKLDITITP